MKTDKNLINLVVICKLFDQNVYDTIFPLTKISKIKSIFVFRDKEAIPMKGVNYLTSSIKPSILRQLFRFFAVLFFKSNETVYYYGIYDFPHSIIAVFAGLFRKRKSIFGFISNPNFNRSGLKGKLLDFAYKNCNILTTPGNYSKSVFIKKGISVEKIFIIPNAINTDYFKSSEEPKIYDLLFLARLSFEKHPELFIQLVKNLKSEYPNIQAVIAGTGPLYEEINSAIINSSLQQNITMLGYVPDASLVSLYSKSKIYLMFSETEGQPRSAVEAMSCGVPVILSKVGDCADIVTNGSDGFLVDNYHDINEYASNVKNILSSDEYESFSKQARLKAETQFSYNYLTEKWENILENLKR